MNVIQFLLLSSVSCFKKLYQTDPALANTDKQTTVPQANNAFGECRCDVTLNSCDVYCCCDQDCNIDIRNFWKENYNEYCAKNTIMKQYKPYS